MKDDRTRSYLFFTGILLSILVSPNGYALGAEPVPGNSSVHGYITFAGSLAEKTELMAAYRDSEVCGENIQDEAFLVDPATRGIKGVVVSLEGVLSPISVNGMKENVIESERCRFAPRTTAVMGGSTLRFRNRDPILHDTQLIRPNTLKPIMVNVLQRAGSADVVTSIHGSGIVEVRCNVHSFMHGSILVFHHPYFAITDEKGEFHIPDVPTGTYQVQVWHETLGLTERTVSLRQGESTVMNLKLGQNNSR